MYKLQLQCYALSLLNYASAEVYKFVNLIYLYTIGGGYTGVEMLPSVEKFITCI